MCTGLVSVWITFLPCKFWFEGRTGRVGNPGRATSFIDEDADAEFAGKLVQLLNADEGKLSLPDWLVEMASGAGAANGGGEGSDEEEDW